MLKSKLIHPQILEALGRAGHSSKVLICDGNFPASTSLGPNSTLVNLNLSPGVVTCTQVLDALLSAIPVEAANVMDYYREGPYALDSNPPIWAEFSDLLGDLKLEPIERFAFYEQARSADVALTIATADQRIYANLMLTIGVVMP